MIKDSGNRTTFESGAVRDIQEGKGRCDLLPLNIVANFIQDEGSDKILQLVYKVQEALKQKEYIEVINYLKKVFIEFCNENHLNRYTTILEYSIHLEEGAKKYGEHNWQKGIPENRYIDSALRHYLKFKADETDERHDRAFIWNICALAWTINEFKIDKKYNG